MAGFSLEDLARIVAERVRVRGILVTAGNLIRALAQQVDCRMPDLRAVAAVSQRGGEPLAADAE